MIDAFLAAAREGDFARLLHLLAPDAVVRGDEAAILAGTPKRIDGRDEVAAFFDGGAAAALSVFIGDRPGAAWFHRGQARVAFDFTIVDGVVRSIDFRAAPDVLAQLSHRTGAVARLTLPGKRPHVAGGDRRRDRRPSGPGNTDRKGRTI